jgi:UDP:flavonoid glycosyltransferase YjiC (YdhE family)
VASAALAHGVAQALLPEQLEQYLVARRLTAAGVAHMLDPDASAEEVAPFIAGALADEGMRSTITTLALKRPAGRASARIAQMLEA